MKVRLTILAARQVAAALDYVAEASPQGAANIRRRILEISALLESHPQIGHRTDRPGVRRLVVTPYPYFIDYRVVGDEVIVMRFRHAARRPV
jgi:plasmid stabilization system protein ParE